MEKLIEKLKERKKFIDKANDMEINKLKDMVNIFNAILDVAGEFKVEFSADRGFTCSRIWITRDYYSGINFKLYTNAGKISENIAASIYLNSNPDDKEIYMPGKTYEILKTFNYLIEEQNMILEITSAVLDEPMDVMDLDYDRVIY